MRAVLAAMLRLLGLAGARRRSTKPVTIRVDTTVTRGPMYPFWAWFGHDEPNYTYTPNGMKLLSALQELSPVPVFMRVHNLLTSGDGKHALKWGSTNVYTEDADGQARLRLDDPRSHRRHLPGARHEAVRAARLHARGVVVGAAGRAVPALLEAGRSVQRHLHRLDLRAEGLPEVGGALLSGDAALRREVRPRARSRAGGSSSGTSPTSATGAARSGPARPRRSAGGAEGADAARRVQQALRLHGRGRAPRAADGADRRPGGDRRRAGDAAHVPAAHVGGHQLRDRQDRHAARPHHLPRQGQPDVRREPRAHGRGQSAPQHRQPLRGRQGVPDVREDADRHRRVRSRRLRGVRRDATIRRTAIATARCSRPTRRCRSRARTSWPICTR